MDSNWSPPTTFIPTILTFSVFQLLYIAIFIFTWPTLLMFSVGIDVLFDLIMKMDMSVNPLVTIAIIAPFGISLSMVGMIYSIIIVLNFSVTFLSISLYKKLNRDLHYNWKFLFTIISIIGSIMCVLIFKFELSPILILTTPAEKANEINLSRKAVYFPLSILFTYFSISIILTILLKRIIHKLYY